ncbi:hypothetical protein IWW35_000931, partial [Coemansia sp. RSA 1878]
MTQGSHSHDPPGGMTMDALVPNNAHLNPLPAQSSAALGNASAGQALANDLSGTVEGSSDATTAWEDTEMAVQEEHALEVQVPVEQALTVEETLQEQAAEIQS